jgi:excisionase family DNA binding protein
MPTVRDGRDSSREERNLPCLVDISAVSRSFGISVRQVRRFVADGQIPYIRVGNLIRFDPDELNDWLDDRRDGSVSDQLA